MKKKDGELYYSGLIVFAAKMLSIVTGLVFQLMIARATSLPGHESEYDLWFNINDVLMYFTLLAGVLPFWIMRFAAREKEGTTKTGILVNFTIAIIATLIYLPLIPTITSLLNIGEKYVFLYVILSIQIVEIHLLSVLEAYLHAKIPQKIGYGLLIQQFFKVILGYILVIQIKQPLLGAITASMLALFIQAIYYSRLLDGEWKKKVRWRYVKDWVKGSILNIYHVAGNQIAAYVLIMLFAFGGEGARGRYGAAAQIANVITYSYFLAYALYPKLLADRKRGDVILSLRMVLMFAIPMTVGAMVLSDSYIIIMKGTMYRDAAFVLIVLAINAFLIVVSGFFNSVLFGFERVDEGANISFKALIKSRLIIPFSLPYIHSIITLPTAFYFLNTYTKNQPFQSALYVSLINASAHLVSFLVLYSTVKKVVKIDIPWKNIKKYLLASSVMVVVLLLVPHPTKISVTLLATAMGAIIYLSVLTAIDKETRALLVWMWQKMKNTFPIFG